MFIGIVISVIYVLGDLPTNTKKWMRVAVLLFMGTVVLGVSFFLKSWLI